MGVTMIFQCKESSFWCRIAMVKVPLKSDYLKEFLVPSLIVLLNTHTTFDWYVNTRTDSVLWGNGHTNRKLDYRNWFVYPAVNKLKIWSLILLTVEFLPSLVSNVISWNEFLTCKHWEYIILGSQWGRDGCRCVSPSNFGISQLRWFGRTERYIQKLLSVEWWHI